MTKQQMIDLCLQYPQSYEDYPFDPTTTLIRHEGNKKMFALIDHLHDRLHITLKCDPVRAEILRNMYEDVIPGYHFNKKHWNTVFLNGDVPFDEICELINHSFDLTKPKQKNPAKS